MKGSRPHRHGSHRGRRMGVAASSGVRSGSEARASAQVTAASARPVSRPFISWWGVCPAARPTRTSRSACAGEALWTRARRTRPRGVGERRQPEGGPERHRGREDEHQQGDEGEVDGTGGPGEGGSAGVVGSMAPVKDLGVVEGDVGVVHGEDGRAEAGAVEQAGKKDEEGDGDVQRAICPTLVYLRRRVLFERRGVWLREGYGAWVGQSSRETECFAG